MGFLILLKPSWYGHTLSLPVLPSGYFNWLRWIKGDGLHSFWILFDDIFLTFLHVCCAENCDHDSRWIIILISLLDNGPILWSRQRICGRKDLILFLYGFDLFLLLQCMQLMPCLDLHGLGTYSIRNCFSKRSYITECCFKCSSQYKN